MPKIKNTEAYSSESLQKALHEVQNGGKIREIARKYGIPKSTLHFKIKHPEHKSTFGPSPYLNNQEETRIENWIIELSKKGFPLKKEDLQSSVQRFLVDHPRPNPFKDNYPGEGWVRGFLKRHPGIGKRTSEGVTFSSACVSETDIRKWFAEIHQYFTEKDLLEVLDDPKRVFNGDESGFQLCPKTGKVLALKGMKNVYNVETSSSKDSMTVMFTFSAAGAYCPPMVVYNYQRIPQKVIEGIPSEWGVGRSENGWMTSELFFEYMANVFHPYLIREHIPLPIIYFLDGHKTHLTYEVSKLCTELQIELIALYPNATRILQPADVAVFRPIKAAWKAATREWLSQNPGQVITKVNFAEVLNAALQNSIKNETLINGFRACGLAPFNPDAVDYSKCIPSNKQADVDIIQVPNNDDTITFSQFLSLIGPNKAAELQSIEDLDQIEDNLQILHNVYKAFGSSKTTSVTTAIKEQHLTSEDPKFQFHTSMLPNENSTIEECLLSQQADKEMFNLTSQRLTPIPNNTHEDDTISLPSPTILRYTDYNDIFLSQNNDVHTDFSLLPLEQTNISQVRPKSPIKILQDIVLMKQPGSDSSYTLCPATGIITKTRSSSGPTSIEVTEAITELERTPMKQSNTLDQGIDILQPLPLYSEISPAFKVRNNADLGPYLTLPKTPERKGKREIKRMPFAITSDKYKTMYKNQIHIKESQIRQKEERKKSRAEAKAKKESCNKEKLKEGIKAKKKPAGNNTNACKICSKTTKTIGRVVCDMCSLIFHVKCVPPKHKKHVPEHIDTDLYVCHTCYKEENDEDEENNSYKENNSDAESTMSVEENSEEAHQLYKMLLDSKKTY